jgi:hypothetical protein
VRRAKRLRKSMLNLKNNLSRALRVLGASGMLLLVQPAGATEPVPVPSGQALGTAEALLNYCSKVDSAAAGRYQERLKMVVQDAGEQALAKIRQGNEYRQAYDAMTARVGQVDQDNARRACAAFLAPNEGK